MVENHTLECADISKVRIYYTKHINKYVKSTVDTAYAAHMVTVFPTV